MLSSRGTTVNLTFTWTFKLSVQRSCMLRIYRRAEASISPALTELRISMGQFHGDEGVL
jgi:hypothetical protein